jgi:hypothetical protein
MDFPLNMAKSAIELPTLNSLNHFTSGFLVSFFKGGLLSSVFKKVFLNIY